MASTINWFEIPVTDFGRAKKFYGEVLSADIHEQNMGEYTLGFFPFESGGVSGALCHGKGYTPSKEGTLIYLNGGNDLSEMLGRVEKAGGKIAQPKTQITPEIGYMAIFFDTEGNKVALHSPN